MASHHLGEQFDLHTGGVDHVAVHHPNEIAQSENAFGKRPWVRFWLHGAWLLFDGEKISKSHGHVRPAPNLDDLAALGVTPAGFRYYLYTAHYRQPLTLTGEALRGAEAARRRLRALVRAAHAESAGPHAGSVHLAALARLRQRFVDALRDDLDAPRALAVLWEIAHAREAPVALRGGLVAELGGSIGLDLLSDVLEDERAEPEIERLLERREQARHARDFALSDAL